MPREIRKLPSARIDLIEIWQHSFEHWGATQADKYLDKIDAVVERLRANPKIGVDESGLRADYYSIKAESHRIFYRIKPGFVEIVRILHVRMNVERHLR